MNPQLPRTKHHEIFRPAHSAFSSNCPDNDTGHVGIRTKTHKLIFYYGCTYNGEKQTPPAWELYDLSKDPRETVNQYDNPAYAGIVTDLKNELADIRKNIGDNGKDHPKAEAVIQEFWDYDEADRSREKQISHDYLKAAQEALSKPKKPRKKKPQPKK